jgi:hydrogenase maturation factor HypF (carbamoyltransferase family)
MVDADISTITLPKSGPAVLACGAWLKNTICLTQGNQAYVSPLIGDLDSANARQILDNTVQHMCQTLNIQPEIVTHDLHPDFYSTQFACAFAQQNNIPTLAVQHHHAHIAAICVEHAVTHPVLGLALDGVGLGTDKTSWGGEFLLVDGASFQRIGHLATLALPGGDRAAREPWRMAAAVLAKLNRNQEIMQRFANQPAAEMVSSMLQAGVNCPPTSSMGRLFDAAAGILGIDLIQTHEAQAAIRLQKLAEQHGHVNALTDGYQITQDNILDFSPLLAALIAMHDENCDVAHAAALFHATLAAGLVTWIKNSSSKLNMTQIALGGGCFHNELLLQLISDKLQSEPLQMLTAQQMQPDDSAIALGQAWVAIQRKNEITE